ncbi:MAG: hypothetical protein BVN29_18300 [Nitrospira sp. ST-bin5]|nr:MAG: hypothetical protein BVN29_18300 [Nitrospira sp. ST-bin5]
MKQWKTVWTRIKAKVRERARYLPWTLQPVLEAGLEPLDGARRQRRALARQVTQREIEVSRGQLVQVQLLEHSADSRDWLTSTRRAGETWPNAGGS